MSRFPVARAVTIAAGLALSLGSGCGKGADAPAKSDGTLLTPYLAIGESLAADNIDNLSTLGAQVVSAAEGKADQPGVADMIQGAGRIGAQDIATARTAFKKMSAGMITHLKAQPDQQDGKMIVHCTMTFGGKGGLWVQPAGKVMNPYEGAMMLHCGDKLEWSADMPET